MNTTLLLVVTIASLANHALAQGTVIVNPVPVTNGITGTLADSSIVAARYYGPAGTSENSLLMLGPASALESGFAQFDSQSLIPGIPTGASLQIGVRAWSLGYPTYEAALASGLPSTLAGKSILLTAIAGGSPSPPPVPGALSFPGFTVYPVPEVSTSALMLAGLVALGCWRYGVLKRWTL
jgi:hypothetical protein